MKPIVTGNISESHKNCQKYIANVKHNRPVISSSVQFVVLPTMVPFAPLAPGTTLEAEDCSRDTVPPSLFVLVFIESFLFKQLQS